MLAEPTLRINTPTFWDTPIVLFLAGSQTQQLVTNCHLIGHNLSLRSALLKQAQSGCDGPLPPTLVTRIQGTLASLGADLQFRLKTEVAPNQRFGSQCVPIRGGAGERPIGPCHGRIDLVL